MRTISALLLVVAPALAGSDADAFAHDLFARLLEREGNVVCSPLSVRVALAMAYGGAEGATAEEMARILRCDRAIHEALMKVARDYDGKPRGATEMPALANAAWFQSGVPTLPAYVDLVSKNYGAPPEAIDFAATDAASRRINAWVAERTRDRIREIVSPDMFGRDTRLVLASALHFKAAWEHPFRPRATREQAFALASGEKATVPFMVLAEHLAYADRDGAQAVELPYAGGRFSMVLVLLAPGAPAEVPAGLLDALEGRQVSVQLPRFRIECAFRLESALAAMGMKSAFGPGADFSGIDGKRDLFLALVAHKAFVAVDENGTEAAAATVVAAKAEEEPGEPVLFRADRPFLFLIRDRESGAVLFLGRISDPRP